MNFGGGGKGGGNDCSNLAYHLNMDLYTMNKTIQKLNVSCHTNQIK